MELKIDDPVLFKAVFRGITRFTDVARFDVSHNGIRVRSIDPHDFCYVDIKLSPSFFDRFNWESEKFTSEAEIGKLRQVISKITRDKTVYMDFRKKTLALNFVNSGKTRYALKWNDEEQFDLPEPQKLNYTAQISIPAGEFLEIINEATAVSREIYFGIDNGKFVIGSEEGGFSFSKSIDLNDEMFSEFRNKIPRKAIKSWTIIDYLKTISEVVLQCGEIKLSIGEDLPIRVDLAYRGRGSFTFIISNKVLSSSEEGNKRIREHHKSRIDGNTKQPHISVTKFPKFLELVKEGVSSSNLRHSRYETEDGDYLRLSKLLKFTTERKGIVYLSSEGKEFLNSLDKRSGKSKFNKKLKQKIPKYNYLLKLLSKEPQNFDSVLENLKKSKRYSMKKEEIMLFLGLATWCNAIDRKLGLFYFGK
ncbi:MAG: hypothetical protein J4F36_07155 [Nitrosopumilaceae archaeon]|nr:hypothetical protein [Nitrosopumilaceae archaeon]